MHSILWPCLGMVAVTAVVWLRLYFERVGEMRARRIRPQQLATQKQSGLTLEHVNSADNFRNLFEMPVLFYVVCIAALALDATGAILLSLAWAFVALRAVHSAIHCTYNRVTHRFAAYTASSLVLFGMWLVLGLSLALR